MLQHTEMQRLTCAKSHREPGRVACYLHDKHKRRRQFAATLRAGGLPVQQCKPSARYYRCGGAEAPDTCFMCGFAPESVAHFMFECSSYSDIREESCLEFDPVQLVLSEDTHHLYVHVWFEQWRKRIARWRELNPDDPISFLGGIPYVLPD